MTEHVRRVGEIFLNLQSLEFLLRGFLFGVRDEKSDGRYENMPVGNTVTENSLTNYHTLGKLIEQYNKCVVDSARDSCLRKDDLVALRDALAHGRVFSLSPDADCVLLKFSKPKGGKVKITYSQNMDTGWYRTSGQLTFEALNRVLKAGKRLGVAGFDVAAMIP